MSQRHRFQAIAALACAIAAASALEDLQPFGTVGEGADRHGAGQERQDRVQASPRQRAGRAIFTIDANGKAERRIRPQPAWWTTSPTGRRTGRCSCSTGPVAPLRSTPSDRTAPSSLASAPSATHGPDAVELHCEDGEGPSFLPDGQARTRESSPMP